MKRKTSLLVSIATLVLLIFGSVAVAGGVGSVGAVIRASFNVVQNVFTGPDESPEIDPQTGCGSSATSTNCAIVKTSQPAEQAAKGFSTATSYTEVASTKQSGKIDAHLTMDNTLKDISFCGNLTLKARQVFINGVDVGQRIAQLASSDQMGQMSNGESLGQAVCNSMPHNMEGTKGILEIRDVTTPHASNSRAPEDDYVVYLGTMAFAVNPVTNEITNIGAYDGTLVPLGTLK